MLPGVETVRVVLFAWATYISNGSPLLLLEVSIQTMTLL